MAFCTKCGAQLPDGAQFCTTCGAPQAAPAPAPAPQPQPQYQQPQYQQPQYQQPQYQQPQYQQPVYRQPVYQQPVYQQPQYQQPVNVTIVNQQPAAPAAKLKTNRKLVKFIFFSILTFGIYPIVFYTNISTSINTAASRYDGKKTMNYCLVFFIFSWLTFGIVPFVWTIKLCSRIGNELKRRNIPYSFGAGTFWGWGFFGSLIFVGPFIFIHKLAKSMNLICQDYNVRG